VKVMGLGGAAQASALPHPEKGHIWRRVASTAPTSCGQRVRRLIEERGGEGWAAGAIVDGQAYVFDPVFVVLESIGLQGPGPIELLGARKMQNE
jgi:hypothetical protein